MSTELGEIQHPLFHGYENKLYFFQATLGTKPTTFTDPIMNRGPGSPLGLSYDAANTLCTDFRGDAFLLSWGAANPIADMPDSNGQDLLHLDILPTTDGTGFEVRTTRLVTGFDRPIDSIFIGNRLYVIENGASGRLFEIALPVPG